MSASWHGKAALAVLGDLVLGNGTHRDAAIILIFTRVNQVFVIWFWPEVSAKPVIVR